MNYNDVNALMRIVPGNAGGKHVAGSPLTTDLTREAAPTLLLSEIDRQIVKIRPMATPLEQISRHAHRRHASSMVVEYYSVDTKPTRTLMAQTYTEGDGIVPTSNIAKVRITTENDENFDLSDTILVQGVQGYDDDGVTLSPRELVLYVTARDVSNGLMVIAVNGKRIGQCNNCLPTIPAGTTLIRMGRAASELDVMSPQFEALPRKQQNFCQIFKMQVEQSTLQAMADKEVEWRLSDQEIAALYDMRLGMEKSFLFGTKQRLWDADKREFISLTDGIWSQAGKQFTYTEPRFTPAQVIELMRQALTGNNSSKRKVLIGGSRLVAYLSNLNYHRLVLSQETTVRWGIEFTELNSKFGKLYLVMSEVFDECGMSECGIVIDPDFITKYIHIPFSVESLRLKDSGIRNTAARVLTEASCLVLRYPNSHMRIVRR